MRHVLGCSGRGDLGKYYLTRPINRERGDDVIVPKAPKENLLTHLDATKNTRILLLFYYLAALIPIMF